MLGCVKSNPALSLTLAASLRGPSARSSTSHVVSEGSPTRRTSLVIHNGNTMPDDHDDDHQITLPPLMPTTTEGQQIIYTNNKAHILGLLHEHALWCTRNGLFTTFTSYRGVLVKQSIAVDNATAAIFYKYLSLIHI